MCVSLSLSRKLVLCYRDSRSAQREAVQHMAGPRNKVNDFMCQMTGPTCLAGPGVNQRQDNSRPTYHRILIERFRSWLFCSSRFFFKEKITTSVSTSFLRPFSLAFPFLF